VQAVKFARDHDVLVAIRGGGHNVAGRALCDDGIVIDLSAMKAVFVDPLAWIQVGKETVDVSDAGDMAVYRTTYNFRSTDPKTKKEAHEHGNWVIGYKKQANDSWKIAWSVATDTPAEAAAAAPAAK